jgi:phosphoribosyl-ATP pyrophosphohydrolase
MAAHRLEVLAELADTVASRRGAAADTSYTARLLVEGKAKCAKKLGEEAVELILASVSSDDAHIKSEAADVVYHLLVLLEACRVPLSSVMDELAGRMGESGIDEKRSRKRP